MWEVGIIAVSLYKLITMQSLQLLLQESYRSCNNDFAAGFDDIDSATVGAAPESGSSSASEWVDFTRFVPAPTGCITQLC